MKGRTTGAVAPAIALIALIAVPFCARAQSTVEFLFSVGDRRIVQEGATVNLLFDIKPAAEQAFTLRYEIDYDSADANDHEPLSGSVDVASGASRGNFNLTIRDDTDVEPTVERFTLRLLDGDDYDLASGNAYKAITVTIQEGICDRTPDIVEGYLRVRGGLCHTTDDGELAKIIRFSRSGTRVERLKERDFQGLVNVERLSLHTKQLASLWPRQFEGLQALDHLRLHTNHLAELPEPVFRNLANLEILELYQNRLAGLPANVFQGLTSLQTLQLHQNQLAGLPANVFNDLTSLQTLHLHRNQIAELPPLVFRGLTSLQTLHLHRNQIAELPWNVFQDLESIQTLHLHQNQITELPHRIFVGLTSLNELRLDENQIAGSLPPHFSNLTNLQTLRLDQNRITELQSNLNSGLENLNNLYLNGNRLITLPPSIFVGFSNLERLHLRDNPGAPFRLPFFLRPTDPNVDLSAALLAGGNVRVKLTMPTGAPYALNVSLEASGVTVSTDQVTIPAGRTGSEAFTVTRAGGANPFEIGFAELPAPPDNFDGFEIVGVPTVHDPDGAGPQVSDIRFTSLPQNPGFYRPQLEETVNVDVIFDKALLVTIPQGASSPTLALQIGNTRVTADYVPNSGGDDALISFSYTLTPQNDEDEDGISVVSNGLQFNGATVTDLFGRPASNALATNLLADNPEHKVQWTALLSFADSDGYVSLDEGETVDAAFNLDFPLQESLVARYNVINDTADRNDYTTGSREVTVPAGETTETIRISITNDNDVEPARERFYLEFVDSADYALGTSRRLAVTINEGVCDRTQQVRDALVSGSGGSHCTDPDGDDLSEVTELDLRDQSIASLKPKDFLELTNLNSLRLHDNALTELPAGVFDGLSRVTRMRLWSNRLTSLPAGVFAGINGDVTASGNANLWLRLENNRLSSLPPGVFSGTDGLVWLDLRNNHFTVLPTGLFSGMPDSLRALDLRGNLGAPFSLILGIELAGEPEPSRQAENSIAVPLRAILREGAPHRVSFSIRMDGEGDISPSQEAIPAGGTESGVFTATQPVDAERAVSLIVETPPDTCEEWHRDGSDKCFNGFEVSAGPAFVLDSNSLRGGINLKIRVFLEGALE